MSARAFSSLDPEGYERRFIGCLGSASLKFNSRLRLVGPRPYHLTAIATPKNRAGNTDAT
jgi:hypothetical protein